jgi:5'-phosphate synthase pdxT subunit
VLEHVRALREVGLDPVGVRTAEQLASVVGLVLPGGESTAISRAAERSGLSGPLAERIRDGMPVLGTCAGLILLSDELDGDDDTMPRPRGLAVRTRRNAYGSQVDSFDVRFAVAGVDGGTMEASFIRAPRIETILDQSVTVLAEVDGAPVAVRQGAITGLTFHPEVSGDLRMHARFAEDVLAAVAREAAR